MMEGGGLLGMVLCLQHNGLLIVYFVLLLGSNVLVLFEGMAGGICN